MTTAPRDGYDLLVIGGGINGLGIAADAAARGLTVCIAERGDWGGGTSSASSRLIHGGLRYLQYGEIDLVRESLRERGYLARRRPHLVRPISLTIPAYAGQPTPRWMIGVGLALYDLLARDPLFAHPSALSVAKMRAREPGLSADGLTGGFAYPDAQVEFPERMCVELMREARAAGADCRNHTGVTRLLRAPDGRVTGAVLRDGLTGDESEIAAALTVNAAGPWVDVVNRTLPTPPPPMIGGTWGTHLILPARPDAGPRGPLYATAKKDGRPFFLLPWDGRLLVGTTDVKFSGDDPDTLGVEPWEVGYLLDETNRLFPGAAYSEADVEATTVGIRPLPASGDKKTGAITRRHFLVDHGAKHGVPGLASVVGGKLTTYRSLSEEVVDQAFALLGRPRVPCPTAAIPADVASPETLTAEASAALAKRGLPSEHAPRLVNLYGPAFRDVLRRIERAPSLGRPLGPGTPHLAAQVVHAVEAEGARTAEDVVRRRLMLLPPTAEATTAVETLLRGAAV